MLPAHSYIAKRPLLPPQMRLFDFEDSRLLQLRKLIVACLRKGIGFDAFYSQYIDPRGSMLFWNPFWRHGESYSPAELFTLLHWQGFGSVPEAALNVFWQLHEDRQA